MDKRIVSMERSIIVKVELTVLIVFTLRVLAVSTDFVPRTITASMLKEKTKVHRLTLNRLMVITRVRMDSIEHGIDESIPRNISGTTVSIITNS